MPAIVASRRLLVALSACLLTLVPMAAAGQEPSPNPDVEPSPLPSASPRPNPSLATSPLGRWEVVAYDAWGEGLVEPRSPDSLSLTLLDDGRIEGSTGCGRYTGGWSLLDEDEIRVGMAPTGFLDCGEKRTEEAVAFSVALDGVISWAPSVEGIDLLGAAGTPLVVLHQIAEVTPEGTWAVERYRRPNGSMREPLPDRPALLTLAVDGGASGSTGCRIFEGAFTHDGDRVAIGPIDTEGLPCKGDEQKAERQLLRALGEVVYWQRAGDTLTLADGFDEVLLTLVAAPEQGE